MCTVQGPRQTRRATQLGANTGHLYCEFKYAPFATTPRRGYVRDAQEKDLSQRLTTALMSALRLDEYPRLGIEVFVTCLEEDGEASVFAAAVTAASVACAQAGLEMWGLLVGCAAGYVQENVLVDCNKQEEQKESGGWVMIRRESLNDVASVGFRGGTIPPEILEQGLATCTRICGQIYQVALQALKPPEEIQSKSEKIKAS